jgi:hypothetical protein
MKRISPTQNILEYIEKALTRIEEEQEHDDQKVEEAIERLKDHGGVELHMGDSFELRNYSGEGILASPGSKNKIVIGKMEPSLKGDMYIIGRDPDNARKLVYYKVNGSEITRRECSQKANVMISRFDLALVSGDDRVRIFNMGINETDLYFEGEVQF